MTTERRCDIQVTGTRESAGIFLATGLTINGHEVLLPEDAEVVIDPVGQMSPLCVTIRLFATSLHIGSPS